jgi:hypothetical protein
MNFFKKGPELKMPDWKVPGPLHDLYLDLRERHLLPLVAILVVAIIAVPIALSQGSGPGEEEAGGESAVATPSVAPAQRGELVAKSAPGLRDYRRRLRRLRAKDPFEQQYTTSEGEGGSSTEGTPAESESSSSGESAELQAPNEAPTELEPNPESGQLTYFSFAIDVRVRSGNAKPQVRHNLPELTVLPNRQTPAVIFMGASKDEKKTLMLVSSGVESIFGDAKCLLGSTTCELLAMETGIPETFVYGGAGKTFMIEILKIHLVRTDKLHRAPLGKPNPNHRPGGRRGAMLAAVAGQFAR